MKSPKGSTKLIGTVFSLFQFHVKKVLMVERDPRDQERFSQHNREELSRHPLKSHPNLAEK